MVYIHKKIIGGKAYYTLRISERKGNRVITKDICSLGSDPEKIKLEDLEKNYHAEIRKSYRTLKRFLELNVYEQKAHKLKLKKQELLQANDLIIIEATKLHYKKRFLKLDKKTREEMLENFLLRFAVNSTAIEGNTINLKDAARLFKEDIIPKNHTMREVYDLTNTRKVFFHLLKKQQKLSPQLMIDIHDKLLENIDIRKGFRNHDIHILGQPFKPTPARYVKADVNLLLKWYDEHKAKLHPFVLTVLFHHKFESIHPFSDGNGRTGRMLMNLILMQTSYPPIVVNRKDRKEYLEAMNQADKAVRKSLISMDDDHLKLIHFMASQLQQSYWDVFLF
ncbi:MAG: Fic family protein [Nanoarchaeota archaeon]|nr:Fic family protein [Nanoarchaeota archaeon]